jgi:protein MpaA
MPLDSRTRAALARALARVSVAIALGALVGCGRVGQRDVHARVHAASSAPTAGRIVRRFTLGRSVQQRAIDAIEIGVPSAPSTVLVVGCVHGNEPAGIAIAHRLEGATPTAGVAVWIVPDLNPDGVAAGTRQNTDGVDLNRNFPWRWRPLGRRGDQQYAGPRPLSEPEARAAHRLILRLRPRIAIWFHQPLGLVDLSGGNAAIERQFARSVGLPLRRLARYPGSAVGWQNARQRGTTAFVVELPPGRLSRAAVARYARAVLALANGST